MSAEPRIHELDGVRAIAIALVIGCHYRAFASLLWGAPRLGWVGVNVFFVLSGYLITGKLLDLKDKPHAYRIFYGRRARRILPPYFVVLAICILIAWIGTRHFDLQALMIQAAFLQSLIDTGSIAHGVLTSLREGLPRLIHRSALPLALYRPDTFLHAVLGPTWSVSVEEWFYLLWAPVVLISRRRGIVAAATIAIMFAFFARWLGRADFIIWWTNFFCQLDGLTLGALLALWLRFRGTSATAKMRRAGDALLSAAGITSALLLVILLAWLRPILAHEIRGAVTFAAFGPLLFAVASAAAIAWIVLHTSESHLVCRALRSPAAVWIGRRSYMLYLVHLPVYGIIIIPLLHTFGIPRGEWAAAICSLLLSIAVAAISWEILEAPLLRQATKVYAPPPPAEGAAITMVKA